jgi:hypothetical protein
MPAVKLPAPQMGMTLEQLTALVFRYHRELQYLLDGHLDSANVAEARTTSDFVDFVDNTYNPDMLALEAQLDGKIETYYTDTDPNTWDEADRPKHRGDMWYAPTAKELKRYNDTTNTWQLVEDTTAINAYNTASTAQDTADGKRRVFTSTPTTPYDIGDLWAPGTSGNLRRCIVQRLAGDYDATDWELATIYSSTTGDATYYVNFTASYTTSLTGTNNDLKFTARGLRGANGNNIRIVYVNPGVLTATTTSARTGSGTVGDPYIITVTLKHDGANITATAANVKAAVEADGNSHAVVEVWNATGNDGTGVVTAMTSQSLSGGIDGSDITGNGSASAPYATIQHAIDALPKVIDHNITIQIGNGSYTEDIAINGFNGTGQLYFGTGDNLNSTNTVCMLRSISIDYCLARIAFGAMTITSSFTSSGNTVSVQVTDCRATQFYKLYLISSSTYGFKIITSYASILSCSISMKSTAIRAENGAIVYSSTNGGSGNTTALSAYAASTIGKSGSQPSGTESATGGGEIR